jgi:hypothetical protein
VQDIEQLAMPATLTMQIQRSGSGTIGDYTQEQTDWIVSNMAATLEMPLTGVASIGDSAGFRILGAIYSIEDVTDGIKTEAYVGIPCDVPGLGTNPPLIFYRRGEANLDPGEGTEVGGRYFLFVDAVFPIPGPPGWISAWDDIPTIRSFCSGSPINSWQFVGPGGAATELIRLVEFDIQIDINL